MDATFALEVMDKAPYVTVSMTRIIRGTTLTDLADIMQHNIHQKMVNR